MSITSLVSKKVRVSLRVDPNLVERIDAWRKSLELPPTKTAIVEAALTRYMDSLESEEEGSDEEREADWLKGRRLCRRCQEGEKGR